MTKAKEEEGVTTTLAQGLEQAYEGVRQPSSSTLFWVGGIVAVGLVVFLFWYFLTSSETVSSQRWRELGGIAFPAQLDAYLEKAELRDTPQGRLAQFKKARMDMTTGMRNLADDTPSLAAEARELVAEATKNYVSLSRVSGLVPTLQVEAVLGAARGYEALGDFDEAKKYYQKLVEEQKDNDIGKMATKKLDELNEKANQADLLRLKESFGARGEARPN